MARNDCEGKSQNSTIFATKVDRYEIHVSREERGFVSIINNNFLIATDERLPLGVDIHLRFDRAVEMRKRRTYAEYVETKEFERELTGNVNRASYSLPGSNKRIPITISPNYKPLCKQARMSLKPQYPGVIFNTRSSC